MAMSMDGEGAGDGFAWKDTLSGCICRGEAAPLVEVSMLRSREEVNIGCDREVMPWAGLSGEMAWRGLR